jgi:hypothetical protein
MHLDIEEIKNELATYLFFVVGQISWLKEQDDIREYINKNKITTRIIELKQKQYFTILRKGNVVDQNNLTLFYRMKQAKENKEQLQGSIE